MENGKHERKNSGSSDTSSNQGKFGESKSSKGGDVGDMQKKMKILKDALIKERQEKEGALKVKKDLDKELERFKGQLQEKDSFLMRLKDETSDLQAKYQFEMKKNESKKVQDQNKDGFTDMLGSSISGLSEMFGVTKQKPQANQPPAITADDLKKLQTDYNNAKNDIEKTKEKLLKIGGVVQEATKEANQQNERIEKKLQEIQKDLEGRIQAYKDLEQKYEEVCSVTKRLKWDKEGLEEELGKLRTQNDSLMNVRDELEKEHNEKVRIVDELREVCEKMKSELTKQSEKSVKITTQIEELQTNQQIFDTTRIVKGKSTPAQMLMRKNINNEYLIEIETPTERFVINPHHVQTFGLVKENEDQFYFDYKNARGETQKEIYVSEDRKKILKALKAFVRLAEENKVKTKTEKTAGGLLGQMVSFFNK